MQCIEPITEKDIYKMIKRCLNLPVSKLCKHGVALDLLDLLEKKGHTLDNDFVKAVSNADDGKALLRFSELNLD